MIFGETPVEEALGALVAHAVVLPGRRLKKGHVLTTTDIAELQSGSIRSLIVARLEPGDVEENEGASRIASRLVNKQTTVSEAFTGRVNLYARSSGVFFADKQLVDRLNRVSPAITLATLQDGIFVESGRMVATVKIIPFAVEKALLEEAAGIADATELLSIVPSRKLDIGLIATQLPSLKTTTMDKTTRVLAERLRPSGSHIVEERRVAHNVGEVAEALAGVVTQCDLVILFGASAITDRDDVLPAALEKSGGVVSSFGMPVDPGNLLLLGSLDGKPVIGAPGCARSPAENGFDWILQRAICGLAIEESYISGLGVGGLLMEISARPQPREG